MANQASKDFAKMALQDPDQAEAQLLPMDPSPRKAILSHPEWTEFAMINASEARHNGLIAIRILSDAFFTKCGFLAPEMLATETKNQEWGQLPQDRGNGTREQCVFHNADRLRNEVDLSMSELRTFMNMKVAVNPESMLLRSEQNKTAPSLPVGLMAYQLQRVFKANLDSNEKTVLRKIFH